MKKLILVLILSSSVANANDLNFGYQIRGEVDFEAPVLSFKYEDYLIKIRFKIKSKEQLKCVDYLPDFCGKEEQVDMIELVSKSDDCKVAKDHMIDCRIKLGDSNPNASSVAILHDGTRLSLANTETRIMVGKVTTLVGFKPRTTTYLGFEMWARRPDGIGQIVEWYSNPHFFNGNAPVQVQESLFKQTK